MRSRNGIAVFPCRLRRVSPAWRSEQKSEQATDGECARSGKQSDQPAREPAPSFAIPGRQAVSNDGNTTDGTNGGNDSDRERDLRILVVSS